MRANTNAHVDVQQVRQANLRNFVKMCSVHSSHNVSPTSTARRIDSRMLSPPSQGDADTGAVHPGQLDDEQRRQPQNASAATEGASHFRIDSHAGKILPIDGSHYLVVDTR